MSKFSTKTEAIRNHLETKGGITSWDAINLYKATRLSGIIYHLKNTHGLEIISTIKSINGCNFAHYTLVKTKAKSKAKAPSIAEVKKLIVPGKKINVKANKKPTVKAKTQVKAKSVKKGIKK